MEFKDRVKPLIPDISTEIALGMIGDLSTTDNFLRLSVKQRIHIAAIEQLLRKLRTGQEWYDEFIKEVDHGKVSWPDNASNEYITAMVGNIYLEAAKRASGIEEDKQ